MPDARLALLEGTSLMPYVGDMEAVLAAIDELLGEDEEAATAAEPPEAGAFRTILFTDVEGSTALTQRLGDAKARALLREHERMVREALKAHGGSELKTTGDGFMASFSSATRALESAIAMQRAFAQHNESAEEPILVRVGMNAGEPIAEDEDLFGTAVNLAARICSHAEAGQILTSDVVRQLVAGKGFTFADKGEATLKGFDKPVRLYEVRWREHD
jgi:class 3 adenylate cyclase